MQASTRQRILSKTLLAATAVLLVVFTAACARLAPWRGQREKEERNLAFTLERNLVVLSPNLLIDNHAGQFILGTAAPRTVLDDGFPAAGRLLQVREKETLRLSPVRMDLQGVADAIVGADAWGRQSISIDYRSGLVTYQKYGIERSQMQIFRYRDEPSIWVHVNGRRIAAVVDTSSPDTLVLPSANAGRGTVNVNVAGTDFGPTDVQFANVARARIGNRLLSRFLVSIDYGRRTVGLWRDPRIPG